ncbi:MAG: DUF2971 domain-containing protein [Atopobiaceae bacterium]|nr:DUF2971 domain-containing protein [Atopobiaceae bacterium]
MGQHVESKGGSEVSFSQISQDFLDAAMGKLYPAGFPPIDDSDLDDCFMSHNLLVHPQRSLFHHYPDKDEEVMDGSATCVNYSRESLRSGRVHLSSPKQFNDPFDCTLAIDEEKVLSIAIKRCAEIIGMEPLQSQTAETLADEFALLSCDLHGWHVSGTGNNDAMALAVEVFLLSSLRSMQQSGRARMSGADILEGAWSVINQELSVGDRMRVFCLSTSGMNPGMWAYYANGNKGFCVEYDTSESFEADSKGRDQLKMDILFNTRPVIYRMDRPDCTNLVADTLFDSLDEQQLNDLYLRSLYVKGLSWGLEQEWRFVMPQGYAGMDDHDNAAFFPVKSVCAGALMDEQRLTSLRKVCGEVGVPLYKLVPEHQRYGYHVIRVP